MLRIDRNQQSLSKLDTPSLAGVSITERYDLQEYIANSPKAFFGEVGEDLFILGKEISPSPSVGDRIDLLAVDRDGALVIVELKRGAHKLQMLQAISYAGMISDWSASDVMALLDATQQNDLTDFLYCEPDQINTTQRVLLVAEGYDLALLSAAEWLCGRYGAPISCCQLSLATDTASNAEYLTCSVVYPPTELAQQAEVRGRGRRAARRDAVTWPAHLERLENTAARAFLERCLSEGWENRPKNGDVFVRMDGKRRFKAVAVTHWARGVQLGRFAGDLEYWSAGLSDEASLEAFFKGQRLRFRLLTPSDCDFFAKSVLEKLQSVQWLDTQNPEGGSDDEQ